MTEQAASPQFNILKIKGEVAKAVKTKEGETNGKKWAIWQYTISKVPGAGKKPKDEGVHVVSSFDHDPEVRKGAVVGVKARVTSQQDSYNNDGVEEVYYKHFLTAVGKFKVLKEAPPEVKEAPATTDDGWSLDDDGDDWGDVL